MSSQQQQQQSKRKRDSSASPSSSLATDESGPTQPETKKAKVNDDKNVDGKINKQYRFSLDYQIDN